MAQKYLLLILVAAFVTSCSNNTVKINTKDSTGAPVTAFTDPLLTGFELHDSMSASIAGKKYVLAAYRNDSAQFFVVLKQIAGRFKIIMREKAYGTNNSSLFFNDENNDGYADIVWTKKWQDHSYLFNPRTENFVEVGEFHSVDTLKMNGRPLLYNSQYPLLYYWNEEKSLQMGKCSEDTMFTENHSELFVIDKNYQKISFATLDNFATLDDGLRNSIECGAQIITCYVPPYFGKYGDISIWNSGRTIDSLTLAPDAAFYHDTNYCIDSAFITNYWQTNYAKLLQYGQVFTVRREEPLEYFK